MALSTEIPGVDPSGTDPSGTDPSGTDPSGTDPSGADQVSVAALRSSVSVMAAFVSSFDPARFLPSDAASLTTLFTQAERLAVAGKTLAAARAAEGNPGAQSGHRTAAEWLAAETGESLGDARNLLELGGRLSSQTGVEEALRAGDLSLKQAQLISNTVKENPEREADLLEGAKTDTHHQLRERCLRARAEHRTKEDEEKAERRLHAGRFCTTYTTEEGGFGLRAELSPTVGAKVAASLRAQTDRVFRQAQQAGIDEDPKCYAADALVALITGEGILPPPRRGKAHASPAGQEQSEAPSPEQSQAQSQPQSGSDGDGADAGAGADPVLVDGDPDTTGATQTAPTHDQSPAAPGDLRSPSSARPDPRTWVMIRVDLEALRRGSTGRGELCEIPGVGPVPVSHAREVLGDALCHLVITNGIDVTTLCSLGRSIPEALRIAILERDQCCVVPTCGKVLSLEKDHWQVDFAKGGVASMDNIAMLCRYHHRLKTHQGWRLVKEHGRWDFLPPDTPKPPPTRKRTRATRRPRQKADPVRRPPSDNDPGPDPPLFHLEE
jgi:hypothetical protein